MVVDGLLKGIDSDEFEEIIYHELCHCDDIAKIYKNSGTKYIFKDDSLIQNVKQLYEHTGILMWGEYIAYNQTFKKYAYKQNKYESKFCDAIKKAGISLDFIKNNRDKNAILLYDTINDSLQSLFYGITKNIALISVFNNKETNQKNDELLIAGENHVDGLQSLSYKVRVILYNMQSIAYEEKFYNSFYKLGEIFYSIYRNNGIIPIDKNGTLDFVENMENNNP